MDVYFADLKVTHQYSEIVAGSDFYPFGLAIEDRQITREDYRYGYQGQFAEKDEETGWNHFELREYDPIIGRMNTPDPMRQYWSSYIGMGNDPINLIDPTGGISLPDLSFLSNSAFQNRLALGDFTTPMNFLDEIVVTASKLVDSGYMGSEIAKFSENRTGFYLRGSGVANVRPIPQNPVKGTSLYDCSGWVSYCVGQYHPELAKKLGGGTGDYEYYANKEGGLRTSTEGLQAGDLALWKGHAAIVTAVHGTGFTISHSSGKDGITKAPKSTQFDGLSDPQLKRYGTNGGAGKGIFVGFWTPQIAIGGSR